MKATYKLRVVLFCIFSLLIVTNSFSQEEKYYAAFMYQFTNFITWQKTPSVFKITVFGSSNVTPYLQQLAKEKKVGNSEISVSEVKSVDEIGTCNMLFVPENQNQNIPAIVNYISGNPVLIIAESPGFAKKGAGISFEKVEGKIKFDLNKTSITKLGMVVSIGLERLALNVY